MNKGNQVVCVWLTDYEQMFKESLSGPNPWAFIVDDSIDYGEEFYRKLTFDKIKELYSSDSIYSYKFGLTLQEESDTIKKLYSCECGETVGLENLEEICPKCGTVVDRIKFKDMGWFYIKPKDEGYGPPVKVLHPYICDLICNTNKGVLVNRMDGKEQRDAFKRKKRTVDKIEDFTWEDLFFNKEKLKAFILKYMKSNAELLLMYEDIWYVNCIPLINKSQRPLKVTNKIGVPTINNKDVNVEYQIISECVKEINQNPDMLKSQLTNKLKSLMLSIGNVCSIISKEIGVGKKSIWKSEIVSPRVDSSGRLIIEPIVDETIHDVDVVQLPLDFFRVVFSSDVERICKEMRISPNKIRELVDLNYVLTDIERDFIRNNVFPNVENPYVYISREPCIYMTSVLGVRIHSLIDEMVMRVPFFLLPALAESHRSV